MPKGNARRVAGGVQHVREGPIYQRPMIECGKIGLKLEVLTRIRLFSPKCEQSTAPGCRTPRTTPGCDPRLRGKLVCSPCPCCASTLCSQLHPAGPPPHNFAAGYPLPLSIVLEQYLGPPVAFRLPPSLGPGPFRKTVMQ